MKYIEEIIKYGMYLLAFLIPWQARIVLRAGETNSGFSEYKSISLYAVDILLIFLLLFQFVKFLVEEKKAKTQIKTSKLIIYFTCLELCIFISLVFSQDKILSLYKYGLFLLGIGLFILLQNAKFNRVKLLISFLIGLFVQSGLAIYQFITQSTFKFKGSGMAVHRAAELGVSVIETIGSDGIAERWLRAYGTLDHPNILGGVLALGIIIYVGTCLRSEEKESNSFAHSREQMSGFIKKSLVIKVLFLVALTAGMFFSFSRGAWLGCIMGLFVLVLGYYKKAGKEIFSIMVVIVSVFAVLSVVYSNLFFTRIFLSGRLEQKSYVERTSSLLDAKEIIKNNWVLGVGLGNYVEKLEEVNKNHPVWFYQPAHNTFMLVWAEIGIFGLLFFVAILNYLFSLSYKQENYLLSSLIIAMTAMMMFDHWWWSLHFGILIFWFIIGVFMENKNNFEKIASLEL